MLDENGEPTTARGPSSPGVGAFRIGSQRQSGKTMFGRNPGSVPERQSDEEQGTS
jgi:hypothetical protein